MNGFVDNLTGSELVKNLAAERIEREVEQRKTIAHVEYLLWIKRPRCIRCHWPVGDKHSTVCDFCLHHTKRPSL